VSFTYKVENITPEEKDAEVEKFSNQFLYEHKAEIHGACIKLLTNMKQFYDMWEENFKPMAEEIRPHGRIFAINPGGSLKVNYEPISKTLIILNCDYYGWVKSLALALTADFFEEYHSEHRRYSVHGSLVDKKGHGLAIIGPSGSGKTTLTYGLLASGVFNYVADDWFFVRILENDLLGFSSEKNSYIREDLAKIWPSFSTKLKETQLDSRGRGIADIKLLFGEKGFRESTNVRSVVLLERDKGLNKTFFKLSPEEALKYTFENDFFNPYQLIRDSRRLSKRKRFFKEIYELIPSYILNTIESPEDSLRHLLKMRI
jgi:hypothetical protein